MLRREFIQGSAIVGASLVLPRIWRASSGMWAQGGDPLLDPLVTYGPFVMNSQDQINACIRNYRACRMGEL